MDLPVWQALRSEHRPSALRSSPSPWTRAAEAAGPLVEAAKPDASVADRPAHSLDALLGVTNVPRRVDDEDGRVGAARQTANVQPNPAQ